MNSTFLKSLFPEFSITEIDFQKESEEYAAATFKMNGRSIVFRKAKITPKKVGQFVTVWKRSSEGITAPFSENDILDFMIIASGDDEKRGCFCFPKDILIENGIISVENKDGKRGMRVYLPSDIVNNKQAEKTQKWQRDYFFEIGNHSVPALLKH